LDLRDCQRLMWEIYGERDSRRGADRTILWMLSEAGEVADAYVKGSRSLGGEMADLLAWMLSVCNVVGIDLEGEFLSKYSGGCPRCRGTPCTCPEG